MGIRFTFGKLWGIRFGGEERISALLCGDSDEIQRAMDKARIEEHKRIEEGQLLLRQADFMWCGYYLAHSICQFSRRTAMDKAYYRLCLLIVLVHCPSLLLDAAYRDGYRSSYRTSTLSVWSATISTRSINS
jgi:uncharacterized membrane protein YsdA (DUF1294 family)